MVEYTRGRDPDETGVYACRIPDDAVPDRARLKDIFLLWYENRWCFPMSDQFYRGEVIGWVGPLRRKL